MPNRGHSTTYAGAARAALIQGFRTLKVARVTTSNQILNSAACADCETARLGLHGDGDPLIAPPPPDRAVLTGQARRAEGCR
jgi:hypothetical protein